MVLLFLDDPAMRIHALLSRARRRRAGSASRRQSYTASQRAKAFAQLGLGANGFCRRQ
jgi:hypothetical protein